MTIEQLVDCDADTLEKMTDEELLKHFSAYLLITRPENNPKAKKQEQQMLTMNPNLAKGIALAKSLGIDVGNSLMPFKKKVRR